MFSRKIWLVGLSVAIALATVGPVSAKTTQQILDATLNGMRDTKTMNFTGSVSTKTKYKKVKSSANDIFSMFPLQDRTVKMSFKGAVDVSDPEYEKAKVDLKYSAPMGGQNYDIDIKVVQAGRSYYFSFSSPVLETMSSGLLDLASLSNKWIEFNLDSFIEQMKGLGLNINSTSFSSADSIDPIKQKALIKSLQKNKVVRPLRLADGKMNGQPAHHLRLSFNRAGLQNLLIDFAKISGETVTAQDKKVLAKQVAAWKLPTIDLWVDKTKNYPLRLSFRSVTDNKYYTNTSDFVFNMSDFDKPVDIEVPFYAEPIENVFNNLRNQISSTTAVDTNTTTINLDTL